jgi:hypothetical protein
MMPSSIVSCAGLPPYFYVRYRAAVYSIAYGAGDPPCIVYIWCSAAPSTTSGAGPSIVLCPV